MRQPNLCEPHIEKSHIKRGMGSAKYVGVGAARSVAFILRRFFGWFFYRLEK